MKSHRTQSRLSPWFMVRNNGKTHGNWFLFLYWIIQIAWRKWTQLTGLRDNLKCLDFRFFISRTDTFLRSGCIVSATSDHYFLFQPKHTAYFHYVSYQGKAPYEEYIEETDGGTCKFCSYLKRELISNNRAAAQRYRQTQAPGTELLCATRSPLPGTFSSAYFI